MRCYTDFILPVEGVLLKEVMFNSIWFSKEFTEDNLWNLNKLSKHEILKQYIWRLEETFLRLNFKYNDSKIRIYRRIIIFNL